MENVKFYLIASALPFALSMGLTPLIRHMALRFGWLDAPATAIKTHKYPTPVLGGAAIAAAFFITLLFMRFSTEFPTGTLRNLRGIAFGGGLIFLLGIADDLKKPHGLGFRTKFAVQTLAALILVYYDIRIRFIEPQYLSMALSLLWVVGISNAINIIDIMDGLAATQIATACLGFLCIALPSESIYVNLASAALLGAALGFLPYNFSARHKIFLGDSGSLLAGFILAAVSMGTSYTAINPLGVYAPLFILAIPIYDTLFVMVMRMRRGHSPFLGSRDHFALRLEAMGITRHRIVFLAAMAAILLSFFAFLVTQLPLVWGILIYLFAGGEFILLSLGIARIKMH
ncbi:MAG: MraY family glycosyltransferase [bacterium]